MLQITCCPASFSESVGFVILTRSRKIQEPLGDDFGRVWLGLSSAARQKKKRLCNILCPSEKHIFKQRATHAPSHALICVFFVPSKASPTTVPRHNRPRGMSSRSSFTLWRTVLRAHSEAFRKPSRHGRREPARVERFGRASGGLAANWWDAQGQHANS